MNKPDDLISEVVRVITNAVNLRHIDLSSITADTPLVGGLLNLDSIDVLEAVVAVENHFSVKAANAEDGKKYFQTIGTIAAFIRSQNG